MTASRHGRGISEALLRHGGVLAKLPGMTEAPSEGGCHVCTGGQGLRVVGRHLGDKEGQSEASKDDANRPRMPSPPSVCLVPRADHMATEAKGSPPPMLTHGDPGPHPGSPERHSRQCLNHRARRSPGDGAQSRCASQPAAAPDSCLLDEPGEPALSLASETHNLKPVCLLWNP